MSSKGQQVDITSLPTAQLSQIKKQFDDELEHLTNSFSQLRAAQVKFRECIRSIQDGVNGEVEGKKILVPLTQSLYVPGKMADTENVIVDVGTGFYVEKNAKDAIKFYTAKVDELSTSLKDLEEIVKNKSNMLRMVEEVLSRRLTSANAGPSSATAAA